MKNYIKPQSVVIELTPNRFVAGSDPTVTINRDDRTSSFDVRKYNVWEDDEEEW